MEEKAIIFPKEGFIYPYLTNKTCATVLDGTLLNEFKYVFDLIKSQETKLKHLFDELNTESITMINLVSTGELANTLENNFKKTKTKIHITKSEYKDDIKIWFYQVNALDAFIEAINYQNVIITIDCSNHKELSKSYSLVQYKNTRKEEYRLMLIRSNIQKANLETIFKKLPNYWIVWNDFATRYDSSPFTKYQIKEMFFFLNKEWKYNKKSKYSYIYIALREYYKSIHGTTAILGEKEYTDFLKDKLDFSGRIKLESNANRSDKYKNYLRDLIEQNERNLKL